MSVTNQHDATTRERILAVALELFAARGYEGTSIRDIAENMKMTKAAIFYHFPAKEQILLNILFPALQRVDQILARHGGGDSAPDPARLVTALVDVIADIGPHVVTLLDDPAVGARVYKIANESAITERIENALSRQPGNGAAQTDLTRTARRIRAACAVAAIPAGIAAWQESNPTASAIDSDARRILIDVVLTIVDPGRGLEPPGPHPPAAGDDDR